MTISTKPAAVHGKSCPTTSDAAVRRIVTPRRRRSSITAIPRNRHKDRTWTDSMKEYAHLDSWSAILQGVFASHSQKPRRDILGASSQSTKNRILNLEVRQGVLISVEHQIVNNRRTLPSSSFRAGFSVTSR